MIWEYLILLNTAVFATVLGIIDFKTKLLPNKYVFLLFASSIVVIVVSPIFDAQKLATSIAISFLIFLCYLILYYLSQQTFGLGDVKYSFSLSLPATYIFGISQTINMHIVAFIMGGIFSLFLMIFMKVSKKHAIAFGPFMSLSFFLFLVLSL